MGFGTSAVAPTGRDDDQDEVADTDAASDAGVDDEPHEEQRRKNAVDDPHHASPTVDQQDAGLCWYMEDNAPGGAWGRGSFSICESLLGVLRIATEPWSCGESDEDAGVPGRQAVGRWPLEEHDRKGRTGLQQCAVDRGRQARHVIVFGLGQDHQAVQDSRHARLVDTRLSPDVVSKVMKQAEPLSGGSEFADASVKSAQVDLGGDALDYDVSGGHAGRTSLVHRLGVSEGNCSGTKWVSR